jgi:hypothetical protein
MAVRRTFRDFRVITDFLKRVLPTDVPVRLGDARQPRCALQPVGFNDFLSLNIPAREMLLNPILPERSLAMLYAPRGVGKTLLSLSIGLAVASGVPLLRWSAPRQKRVLYVDGRLSRCRSAFERFQRGLAMEFLTMDSGFWQPTKSKAESISAAMKDNVPWSRCCAMLTF